jgi:hypothetical protein
MKRISAAAHRAGRSLRKTSENAGSALSNHHLHHVQRVSVLICGHFRNDGAAGYLSSFLLPRRNTHFIPG